MSIVTNGRTYLENELNEVLKKNNKLFIPYIMAGDGGLDQLIPTLTFLQEAGASAIELGIPFSDPVADGKTIQKAGIRALQYGVTLKGIVELLKQERHKIHIPIIFMTYINPIFHYGVTSFVRDIKEAGVDGIIIPDLPFEEQHLIKDELNEADIALIQLVSLTSVSERQQKIAEHSEGFLYAVTVNGTTGVRNDFSDVLHDYLRNLKQFSKVPVVAGFGISSPEQVQTVSQLCDGVIVGSKIIELLQNNDDESIKQLIEAAYRF